MVPSTPSLPRPLVTGLAAALLALHVWLALSATIDLGVTGDETVHLTGGYSYWQFNDYRLHPENGNLPQRWAALPLLVARPRLEPHDWPDDWKQSDVWMAGQHFFFQSGNSIDYLLLCARSMMVLWSAATGLLVFFWARALWTDNGALLSLALYTLSPTTLAHGALVTSDMCATFWLLAATGAWWRLTKRVDASRLALSLCTAGLAVAAKFSGVLLLPIATSIGLWCVLQRESIVVSFRGNRPGWRADGRRAKLSVLTAAAAAHFLAAVAVVWMCFGFRYAAFNPHLPPASDFFSSFDAMLPADGAVRWLLVHLRACQLLPEGFLQGIAYVLYGARERATFAAGEYGKTGWWWFFPFAFLVKNSIAELLACASVMAMLAERYLRAGKIKLVRLLGRTVPLLCLAAIYGTFAVFGHLNIGQRHILPLYPIVFIFAGALARPRAGSIGVMLGVLLVGIAALENCSVRPNYLSFFNQLAGGQQNGWRLLGDSSLDWGQNLPRLKMWLDENRAADEQVYLSYFGADDPFYRGIRAVELSPYYSFGRERPWGPLQSGLYCIGTSMLQDASSPYSGPWTRRREAIYQRLRTQIQDELRSGLRPSTIPADVRSNLELWNLDRARFARLCLYLRVRRPDAIIGHTIFIYRLTDEEIRNAVDRSFAELATAMESAINQKNPEPTR